MNNSSGFREIDLIGKPIFCGKTFGSGYPYNGYTCYNGILTKPNGDFFVSHYDTSCDCVKNANNEPKLELESKLE